MLDVTESYLALRRSVAAFEYHRDVLSVRGADAVTFLQGQLSADVAALAVGAQTWTLLLQPQGKVVAWLRASRIAEDRVVLDVDGGAGDAVVERLERLGPVGGGGDPVSLEPERPHERVADRPVVLGQQHVHG